MNRMFLITYVFALFFLGCYLSFIGAFWFSLVPIFLSAFIFILLIGFRIQDRKNHQNEV